MRLLVGVVAAVLLGLASATAVTIAVSSTSAPDRGVNLDNPAAPNNAVGGGSGGDAVNYGAP